MSDTARAVQRAVTRGRVQNARTREGRVIVDMTLTSGETRRGVELMLPGGFSMLPAEGADLVVLEVGGNRNHLVAMVADDPALRIQGLAPGEFGFRDAAGQQVLVRATGIEITSPLPVRVESAERVVVEAPEILLGEGATKAVKLEDDTPAAKVKAE